MAVLTLEQIFGVGAVQDANTITIQKTGLTHLVSSVENSGSSIFAAIVNTAWMYFEGVVTDENFQAVTDETGQSIFYDNHLYYSDFWVQFYSYFLPTGKLDFCFLVSFISSYSVT